MNLSEFTKHFRQDKAEIMICDEQVTKSSETSNILYSHFFINNDLYSLNVSRAVVPHGLLHASGFYQQREEYQGRVFLNRYAQREGDFEVTEKIELGEGEGARVVSNGKQAYALVTTMDDLYDFGIQLYDLAEQRMVPVTIDTSGIDQTRNWQPLLVGEDLYAIVSISPFRLVKINIATGRVHVAKKSDVNFNMPDYGMRPTMLEASSNAISSNGTILGLGIAASQQYRCYPFFWSADDKARLQISFTPFFSQLCKVGFNVIKPTSLLLTGRGLYLSLYCAERDYGHNQLVSNILVRLHKSECKESKAKFSKYFNGRAKTKINGAPNLNWHMFFCLELSKAKGSYHEFGGVTGKFDQFGYLVYGPYLEVQQECRFFAELSYMTKSCPGSAVGVFDIALVKAVLGGYVFQGQTDLEDTHGSLRQARVEINTVGHTGKLLEFCVRVEADVELTVFHIRTWRAEQDQVQSSCQTGNFDGRTSQQAQR